MCVVRAPICLGFCVCVDVQCGVCGRRGGLDGVGGGDGIRRGWKGRRVCEGRNDGLMWLVCKECGGGMAEGCGCVFLLNELMMNM